MPAYRDVIRDGLGAFVTLPRLGSARIRSAAMLALALALIGPGAPPLQQSGWNLAGQDLAAGRRHFETLCIQCHTLGGGRLVVEETPADFSTDFDRLRSSQGWARSSFDSFQVVRASPSRAHVEIEFSRYDDQGQRYGGGRMLYIFTRRGDGWAMQLRTPIPPPEGP